MQGGKENSVSDSSDGHLELPRSVLSGLEAPHASEESSTVRNYFVSAQEVKGN